MTKDDTRKIFNIITMTYRNHYKNLTADETKVGLTVWHHQFGNMPYEVMEVALMQYISTTEAHPPTPAAINKIIYGMISENNITPEESFEKVISLIRESKYDFERLDVEKMNGVEQQIITRSYIKELGKSSEGDINFFRSSYIKLYRGKEDRETHGNRINLNQLDSKKILMLIDKKQFLLD